MHDDLGSSRTALARMPARGRHDFATVAAILDAGFVCHVGFAIDGQPYVIPTCYGRVGERLFLHGHRESRMQAVLASGSPVCVTVTHLDGIVVARSGYHSSINYRSAVILGHARAVAEDERSDALRAIVDRILPGRWPALRAPTAEELDLTSIVCLDIVEASAKIRTGPPLDDEADYALPIWAGVLPVETAVGEPVPDPRLDPGIALPDHVSRRRTR